MTNGCDLFVVTALEQIEHAAVLQLPLEWSPLRLPHDDARYSTAVFRSRDGVERTAVAAVAPRMGMPAAAVLASKAIQQFRPSIIAMSGICAGRVSEISIGDLIAADPAYDWGSGKIQAVEGAPAFLPDAHQIGLEPDVGEALRELPADHALPGAIRNSYPRPKPAAELRLDVGELASSVAVIADRSLLADLLQRARKLLGIEMKAYGVAVAARSNGRPPRHS